MERQNSRSQSPTIRIRNLKIHLTPPQTIPQRLNNQRQLRPQHPNVETPRSHQNNQ